MKVSALFVGLTVLAVPAAAGTPPTIQGEYVEARTAEVFAGGCVMSSEAETIGREAVMAWRISKGSYDGVALDGLSVVAAVAGNCWSVFLLFRGGKGVATGLGALLGLVPLAVLPAMPVWLLVTLTFRYVSLGSLLAAVCVPLGSLLLGYPGPAVLAAAAVAAIIVARHHDNIRRLLAGTERRLGEKRSREAA